MAKRPVMSTLAERLRWARSVSELSQDQLAKLCGLKGPHICLLESGGRANPTQATLTGLADVLGLTLDWLVYGDERCAGPTEETVRAAVEAARSAQLPATGTEGA